MAWLLRHVQEHKLSAAVHDVSPQKVKDARGRWEQVRAPRLGVKTELVRTRQLDTNRRTRPTRHEFYNRLLCIVTHSSSLCRL